MNQISSCNLVIASCCLEQLILHVLLPLRENRSSTWLSDRRPVHGQNGIDLSYSLCCVFQHMGTYCSQVLVLTAVLGRQEGVWQWHFCCAVFPVSGHVGTPNDCCKQGKRKNDKSTLFHNRGLHDGNHWRKYRLLAGPYVPLFYACCVRSRGKQRALRLPGATWDHFRCTGGAFAWSWSASRKLKSNNSMPASFQTLDPNPPRHH